VAAFLPAVLYSLKFPLIYLVSYLLRLPEKVNFLAEIKDADAHDDEKGYYRWKSIGKYCTTEISFNLQNVKKCITTKI